MLQFYQPHHHCAQTMQANS